MSARVNVQFHHHFNSPVDMPENRMRKIHDCFDKQLSAIYKQLLEVEQLNQLVKQFLPKSLQAHCQVTHFNQGRLNISVSEVALATELRFFLPTLRDLLRQKAGLYRLTSLNISIVNANTPSKPQVVKKTIDLSKAAHDAINEASKMGDYEPLQKAWENLINHASSGSSNKG
jgi:hypothetical protein